VAEEGEGRHGEGAFGRIYGQTILLQDSEKLGQMLHVLLQGGARNEVIIEVGEDKGEVAEKAIHKSLECLRRIDKSKRHEQVFKQPKRCDDGRLANIRWIHRHLMITFDKVNAREKTAAMESRGEVKDGGKGVFVVRGDQIQPAVVATGAP